ncbi:late competence development ComFB family protein [Leptolyngbya sp. FACHB-261]|uniref:late competence development ComFB family protein n=1 Tax=Leptolyngbya sp. FACHB-261 TaxID=2692806 RepID=UPI0016854A2E|nr:late competence development ComFB family protein [Leptolyngbya sp. FACHB-261]MBD2104870.1 late competence development ComFB family protein [Leptolyngbya sp. FACHB-261]
MTRDSKTAKAFRNAAEELVLAEAELQVQSLPPSLRQQISPVEVAARALNRLSPLYATSEKGWRLQQLKANHEAGRQVSAVVRQALATVQQAPRRDSPPLTSVSEELQQERVLRELRQILRREDLDWHNLVPVFKEKLAETSQGCYTWRRREPQSWDNQRFLR